MIYTTHNIGENPIAIPPAHTHYLKRKGKHELKKRNRTNKRRNWERGNFAGNDCLIDGGLLSW